MRLPTRVLIALLFTLAAPLSAQSVDDLEWMAGHWRSESDGVVAEEIWMAPAGGMLVGMHRDTSGTRTSFEFMRIAGFEKGIAFFAQPSGRPAIPFRLTSVEGKRAVFSNPEHDFPQTITYWRDGERLCASVAGTIGGKQESEQWCWSRAISTHGETE